MSKTAHLLSGELSQSGPFTTPHPHPDTGPGWGQPPQPRAGGYGGGDSLSPPPIPPSLCPRSRMLRLRDHLCIPLPGTQTMPGTKKLLNKSVLKKVDDGKLLFSGQPSTVQLELDAPGQDTLRTFIGSVRLSFPTCKMG